MPIAENRATLEISAFGRRGEGLAHHGGATIAVPFALPGETIVARIADGRGEIETILASSPARITPFCPAFARCGGCLTQHWAQAPYAAWKRGLVVEALARVGLEAEVMPLLAAHGRGRRRATLHVRYSDGGAEAGFMALRSHALVPITHCPVLVPELAEAPAVARALGTRLRGLGKPLDVVVTASETGLDVDLRGCGRLAESLRLVLVKAAEALDLARLSVHGERILERRAPRLTLSGLPVALPPGGFLQATEAGETAMVEAVTAACAGAKSIADLFCGIGPFSLALSRISKVAAFDSDAPALAALDRALRLPSGRKPVRVTRRDLFRRPLLPAELAAFDTVVMDPPRAGAEAQAQALAASRVSRIISIACDVQSFARDCRILTDGGYHLGTVQPIDQFVHSAHVELIATLTRPTGARSR